MPFKPFRLTFLILFLVLLFFQPSCYKNAKFQTSQDESHEIPPETAININLASAEQLEKLPQIGSEFARRIVEYREKHGKFRRPEHLILVRGMTDKKFRQIKHLVKTE